jgi:hypothetical protein
MSLYAENIERAANMFAGQRMYCVKAAVHTYVAILDGLIDDLRAGGPTKKVLVHWDGTDNSAYPLRVLGALHRLALDGKAPELAALFPTTGGIASPHEARSAAVRLLDEHLGFVIDYCTRPPQTNEVGRSAVLLGGFLTIAKQFGQPLRLLELGASAGLNLMWDQYRINAGTFTWGNRSARLGLKTVWEGPPPPLDAPISVVSRAACDQDPIRISDADDRARLESYIWPDQVHRMERLRAACQVALDTPFRFEKADAADWLESEVRELPRGQTTVVYHSIFRQYVHPEASARMDAIMNDACARATPDAPLAWLAMEIADLTKPPNLTLQTWPNGEAQTLATAHHHGEWVKWIA